MSKSWRPVAVPLMKGFLKRGGAVGEFKAAFGVGSGSRSAAVKKAWVTRKSNRGGFGNIIGPNLARGNKK